MAADRCICQLSCSIYRRPAVFRRQVPRASASAVAFGVGFLEGNGTLGPARHQAFAVISDTKDIDRRLRFHKTCPAYKVRVVFYFQSTHLPQIVNANLLSA